MSLCRPAYLPSSLEAAGLCHSTDTGMGLLYLLVSLPAGRGYRGHSSTGSPCCPWGGWAALLLTCDLCEKSKGVLCWAASEAFCLQPQSKRMVLQNAWLIGMCLGGVSWAPKKNPSWDPTRPGVPVGVGSGGTGMGACVGTSKQEGKGNTKPVLSAEAFLSPGSPLAPAPLRVLKVNTWGMWMSTAALGGKVLARDVQEICGCARNQTKAFDS